MILFDSLFGYTGGIIALILATASLIVTFSLLLKSKSDNSKVLIKYGFNDMDIVGINELINTINNESTVYLFTVISHAYISLCSQNVDVLFGEVGAPEGDGWTRNKRFFVVCESPLNKWILDHKDFFTPLFIGGHNAVVAVNVKRLIEISEASGGKTRGLVNS